MLVNKTFELGTLKGTIFDFYEINDVLPMHSHTEADVHISIIARGSFKVHGKGWEKNVKAGDVVDWSPGQDHEFISTSQNSRLVNIIKGTTE